MNEIRKANDEANQSALNAIVETETEKEVEIIRRFETEQIGNIQFEGRAMNAVLERKDSAFVLSIDEILDFDLDDASFCFTTDKDKLTVIASIVVHKNSVDTVRKTGSRYSEGKVYSFKTTDFEEDAKALFKSYYPTKQTRVLYDLFASVRAVPLTIDEVDFFLGDTDGYITIESAQALTYEVFSETCYNIMVALGFLSGAFIQAEMYIFQKVRREAVSIFRYKYRKLRASAHSMYHALTPNPYGYEHMIGREYAEELYKNSTLLPIDEKSFSNLVELIQNNPQVQYALVLFNDANDNRLSLLVKNNCFYVVLEVLRKYLYDRFKDQLPTSYSNIGNVGKYRMIFEQLIQLDDNEGTTLEKRNAFLHGDIKDIEGEEMVATMQRQITLIYRLLLTLIGFDGHIIDHYAVRNGTPEKAFIKVN